MIKKSLGGGLGAPPKYKNKTKPIKCSLCGRAIRKDVAYAVIGIGKTKYYCSEEEYRGGQEYLLKNEEKEKELQQYVTEILDTNSFDIDVYNELRSRWIHILKIDILCFILRQNKERYAKTLYKKAIEDANHRLKYLGAIIISDASEYSRTQAPDDMGINEFGGQLDYTMYAPRMLPRKGIRRSLADLEDEYGIKK